MINALVIARHSDPAANAVIWVLGNHTAGDFSHNKVGVLIIVKFLSVQTTKLEPVIGPELHH